MSQSLKRKGKFSSHLINNSDERKRLRRQLRGDLDNIVLMALRGEPSRRYSSVEQLSEDIRRHLEGLPVIARKSSFGYRAEKFVGRNKTAVLAAALILATLITGIAATLHQARRAEKRVSELRSLTGSLMFELNDEIEQSPTQARLPLVKRASAYLNRLSEEAQDDRSLQYEVATAHLQLGDLQGRPYRPNVGDIDGAFASYRRARAIMEPLAANNPFDLKVQSDLAIIYERAGHLAYRKGEYETAIDYVSRALRLREAIWKTDESNIEYRSRLAEACIYYGDVINTKDKSERAIYYRHALRLREDLARDEPANMQHLRDMAQAHQRLGTNIRASGASAQAAKEGIEQQLEHHRQAMRLREQIAASGAANVRDQRNMGDQAMLMSGVLMSLNEVNEAMAKLGRAQRIFEALALADPANAEARRDIGFVNEKLGRAAMQAGNAKQAGEYLSSAAHILESLDARSPNKEDASSLVGIYDSLAQVQEGAGDMDGALMYWRKAIELRERIFSAQADARSRRKLAEAYQNIGEAYAKFARAKTNAGERAARYVEARAHLKRSLDLWQSLHEQDALKDNFAERPDKVAREIALCDTALAKL